MHSEREHILDDLEATECDVSGLEEDIRVLEMQGLGEGNPEWEKLDRELNLAMNEAYYLRTCLEDFD